MFVQCFCLYMGGVERVNVVPSPALGLHMQDREFRFCLQYWLGLKMFDDRGPCPVCH